MTPARIDVSGLNEDDITAWTDTGQAVVAITDAVELTGDTATLRRLAVEIDRQLAHLEIEGKVDAATEEGGTP